jgi:hypothetical protein
VDHNIFWGAIVVNKDSEPLPRLFIDQFRRSRSDGCVPYEFWCSSEHRRGPSAPTSPARVPVASAQGPQHGGGAHQGRGRSLLNPAPSAGERASAATPDVAQRSVAPGQHLEQAFQRLLAELKIKPCTSAASDRKPPTITAEPTILSSRSPDRARTGADDVTRVMRVRLSDLGLRLQSQGPSASTVVASAPLAKSRTEQREMFELMDRLNDIQSQLNAALSLVLRMYQLPGESQATLAHARSGELAGPLRSNSPPSVTLTPAKGLQ